MKRGGWWTHVAVLEMRAEDAATKLANALDNKAGQNETRSCGAEMHTWCHARSRR